MPKTTREDNALGDDPGRRRKAEDGEETHRICNHRHEHAACDRRVGARPFQRERDQHAGHSGNDDVDQHCRGDDPAVRANASFILAHFGEEIGATIGLIDRALSLNPSFARLWNISALLRLYEGDLDRAIEHAGTALRLSPRERVGTPLVVIGLAYFFQLRFDEAASKLQAAVQENPGSPATYRILAACYAHMGLTDAAHETLGRLRAITPAVLPAVLPWRRAEHRDLLLSGLRLAMDEAE